MEVLGTIGTLLEYSKTIVKSIVLQQWIPTPPKE